MKCCRICHKEMPRSRQKSETCHRRECIDTYKEWVVANYDLLPDSNKYKATYEKQFWEITPDQMAQFPRFFELMRPNKANKKRKCLKCGVALTSSQMDDKDGRLCAECNRANSRLGQLAECY